MGFAVLCAWLICGALPCRAKPRPHPQASTVHAGTQPGYLGVDVCAVDRKAAAQLRMSSPRGIEIVNVDRDAPAGKAGLRAHDVILAINGQAVSSRIQLSHVLQATHSGQIVHLSLYRDGKVRDIAVKLASRAQVAAEAWPAGSIFIDGEPAIQTPSDVIPMPFPKDFGPNVNLHEFALLGSDGLDVEALNRQLANFFGAPQGMGLLIRDVAPNSPAAAAGLRAGDVITAANGLPAATLRAWLMIVSQNQGKPVQLRIIRNHKIKLIRYTPGGPAQQSSMILPEFDFPIPPGALAQMCAVAPVLEDALRTMEALGTIQPQMVEQPEVLTVGCQFTEEAD